MATGVIDRQVQRSWLIKIIKSGWREDEEGEYQCVDDFSWWASGEGTSELGGALIHSVTTGRPSGLTGLHERERKRERDWEEERRRSHSCPRGRCGAPSVGTWNPLGPEQLQCPPSLKGPVPSHLSCSRVNKRRLRGFISSNRQISFQQTKDTSLWTVCPQRECTYCPFNSSLHIDINTKL